jgi:hypothetical protein
MAQFADTLATFNAWCADRHATEGFQRLERLAMLTVKNNWAFQPKYFHPLRVPVSMRNPWGVVGLDQHEQLELLYYDGFIAGLALASGNRQEFYGVVWQTIQAFTNKAFATGFDHRPSTPQPVVKQADQN